MIPKRDIITIGDREDAQVSTLRKYGSKGAAAYLRRIRLLFKDASCTSNKPDQLPTHLETHTHALIASLSLPMSSGDRTHELVLINGTDNIPILKELIMICAVC